MRIPEGKLCDTDLSLRIHASKYVSQVFGALPVAVWLEAAVPPRDTDPSAPVKPRRD